MTKNIKYLLLAFLVIAFSLPSFSASTQTSGDTEQEAAEEMEKCMQEALDKLEGMSMEELAEHGEQLNKDLIACSPELAGFPTS